MSGDFRVYLGVFETRSSRGGGAEFHAEGSFMLFDLWLSFGLGRIAGLASW